MHIGSINTNDKILIIAEIGNNHEGSLTFAEEAIGLAAKAGVDAVKFQTIVPEKLVSFTQVDRIKQLQRFQFSYEQFTHLSQIAKSEGVMFLSTPFDIPSAIFLDTIVPAFKIASGDNNFSPLIRSVAETGKPILLSAGLADFDAIKQTKEFIESIWRMYKSNPGLAILHCVVSYPTSPDNANLAAIRTLASLGVTVGYSDHTIGINAAVLSVGLGARIIEKHFTIRKDYSDFRDHTLSADPSDMTELVNRVREAEILMGNGNKQIMPQELTIGDKARRSVVAAHDLPSGTALAMSDIDWVRPGGGIAPGNEDSILGKRLRQHILKGEMILPQHIESQE